MKKTILAILAAGSVALFGQQAYADSIAFSGTATSSHDSSKGAGGSKITFKNNWKVIASDGVFDSTTGDAVTMHTVTFTGNGATAVCTTCPEIQWNFTAAGHSYSFTLQVLNSASTTKGAIAMNGNGFATVDGVNYTGIWSMNGTSGTKFNFITTTVPDGGSAVALLGIALAGIEGVRRMIGARKA